MRRTTQQFSITLPTDMADAVRAKVAAGEYASDSEVLREGMRALLARDRAVERWLRTEVATAYDAARGDSVVGLTVDEVRARLASQHKAAMMKA